MYDPDPFRLPEPFVVSFSGGRTSGLMLRRVLDAYGGRMPAGGKAVFCNTGKEREETLAFVERCSLEWGVDVVWLEYRADGEKNTFAVVDYATASRAGEPFAALIGRRDYLPNPVTRFCTQELKIRPLKKWCRYLRWNAWAVAVGIRADEPRRLAKGRAGRERYEVLHPLAVAGLTLADVTAFWAAQPFDLGLRPYEGNCDLCFLKGRDKIAAVLRDRPDLAAWWISQEGRMIGRTKSPGTDRFRADRPSYAAILKQVQEQPLLPMVGDEPLTDCHCTD